MLSPTVEGEPSPKTHKRIRKVLAVAPLLSVQSGLKSKPKPKAEANNSIEKVPEDHPDNIVHPKPFPPSGKNGRVFKKVVIADEKLEGPISFNKEEDRALIADILETRTRLRAPNEIAVLQKAFSDIKFFEKIRPEIDDRSYEKIFQNLTLETFEPGQRVFNYDDIGRKFYIIITGSVFVLLNSDGAVGSETSRSISFRGGDEEDEISYQTRDKLPEYMAKNELTDSQKKSVVEKCYPGFWIVRTMTGGDSFGELALNKNSDGRRTATVICTEKTALGILTKEDYNNILGNLYERLYRDKLEFLSKIDIFSHWTDNQLSSIILNLEEIRVRRKNPVFKEGDAPDRVYFIRQGEIELQAHVDKDEKHEKGSPGIKTSSHFLYRSGTAVGIKNKLTKIHEPVKLGILTERSYFGESELHSGKPRDYTAIAYSGEVLLYSMTREKFLNIVKDEQSLKCLEKHINEKLIWREEMTAKFMNRVNTLELSDTVPTEEMSPKNILQKQNINDYIHAKVNSPPANPVLVSGFDLTKSAGFWDDQVKSPAERASVPTKPSHSPSSAQANKLTHSRLFEKETSPQRTDFVKHFSLPAKPPKKGISYLYHDRKKWLQENVPKGFDEDDFDSERVRETEIEQNQSSFNFVKKGIPLTQSWKFDLSAPLDISNPVVNPVLSPIAHDSHQPRKKVNPFQQKLKDIQTSIKSPRNLQPLNLPHDPSKLLKSPTNHSKYSSPKESMISVSTIGLPKVSANIKGIPKKMEEPQQQRLTTWEGHTMEKDFFAGESLSPKVQSLISSYKKISESAISNMKKKL